MKKTFTHFMGLLALLLVGYTSEAGHLGDHLLFSAHLTGAQETPAVSTNAVGVASFTLNSSRDSMFVQVAVNGLSGPITGVHVHEAKPGVAGPIITPLTGFVSGNRITTVLTGADITAAHIAKYLQGVYYINVHTAANPGGEIRGQILLETDQAFSAMLTGDQEVPPVTTTANGLGVFTLSQDMTKMKVYTVFTGLSGAPTGAHFHTGAPGVAGPVSIDLTSMISGNTISGEVTPTAAQLLAFMTGNMYLNIHTAANPAGEIRGQVEMGRNIAMDARMDGSQEVPPVTTAARGAALVYLNSTMDTLRYAVYTAGLSGPITTAHFHLGAVGVAGAPVIDITPNINGNRIGGMVTGTVLTPTVINNFLKGDMYVNVHTAANPAGEIRGQVYRLAREGYSFVMDGRQEVPSVTTNAKGAGIVSIDRDQTNAHFIAVWSGLSGTPTGAHFHKAKRGVAGPVIFDLGPFVSSTTTPGGINGYWTSTSTTPFTTQNSVQFRNDSIYINVHTAANPGGEIRGDVFRSVSRLFAVTGIAELVNSAAAPFTVYPNPVSDRIELSFKALANREATVVITDILGKTVQTENIRIVNGQNRHPLNLGCLAKGTYLIRVQTQQSNIISRVVKL